MKVVREVAVSRIEYTEETPKQKKALQENIHRKLGVREKGYQYAPLYKRGIWDGVTPMYNPHLNTFGTGLIPQVIQVIREYQEIDPSLQMEYVDNYPEPFLDEEDLPKEFVLKDEKLGSITLRDYQDRGVRSTLMAQYGILQYATNAGKSEIGASIIEQLLPQLKKKERIVFFVPAKEIFYGLIDRLEMRLGCKIGYMGDGKKDIRQINVVLMPSLSSALKDPSNKLKLSVGERALQIMVQDIIPLFDKKVNLASLVRGYLQNFEIKQKAHVDVAEMLTHVSTLSDAKVRLEFNKINVAYQNVIKKKNGAKHKKWQDAKDLVDSAVVLICDEAHRSKADTWYNTIQMFTNAQYRIGLTGSIDTKDLLLMQRLTAMFGTVIERVRNEELIGRDFSAKPFIKLFNVKEPKDYLNARNYQTVYDKCIVTNDFRNDLISMIAMSSYKVGKTTLITTNRLEQGEYILNKINELAGTTIAEFINGELATEDRQRQLADVKSGKLKVLVATTVLDEGVDISGIHTLILGGGGKSLRQVLQRVGRVLRKKEGDNTTVVFDFVDKTNNYMLSHSKERIKVYEEEGFDITYLA